jgi:hypothetical protein
MTAEEWQKLRMAPDGMIWICGGCGKTRKDIYPGPDSSWDDSCMANAVLVDRATQEIVPEWKDAQLPRMTTDELRSLDFSEDPELLALASRPLRQRGD